jgi:hypothetical protein
MSNVNEDLQEDNAEKKTQIFEDEKNQQVETRTLAGPSKDFDPANAKTPDQVQSEWLSHYAKLGSDKMAYIAKLATKTKFQIRVKDNRGKYEYVTKTYTPCTVSEWQQLEDMRGEYQDMQREDQRIEAKITRWVRENDALQRMTGGELKNLITGATGSDLTEKLGLTPLELTKDERTWKRTTAKFLVKLQQKGWQIFFSSPIEEFQNAEWRDASDAVDACNHRTTWSLPS